MRISTESSLQHVRFAYLAGKISTALENRGDLRNLESTISGFPACHLEPIPFAMAHGLGSSLLFLEHLNPLKRFRLNG